MRIVLTGGGSGGHITPILAVAAELKRQHPKTEVIYIGQKGDSLGDLPSKDPNINKVYYVRAGKFRRYSSEGLKQLLDIRTVAKNVRDLAFVAIGLLQSTRLMNKIRPDIVFSRGGYVSVPVCLGAKLNKVSYITHDSDPIPSLANRLIAPWASFHFVALPKEIYKYPKGKTITTGIPLNKKFVPVTAKLQQEYRQKLNISTKQKLLFVIGGGLGARSLNDAMLNIAPHLLAEFPELKIVHIAGRNNKQQLLEQYLGILSEGQSQRLSLLDYTDMVYAYSGAADLIITRAGATNLAEFAVQGRACIVVPSSYLVAGHQLKNAEVLSDEGAVVVVNDIELAADSNKLAKQISDLLKNPAKRAAMSRAISEFAYPDADKYIADLIFKAAESGIDVSQD